MANTAYLDASAIVKLIVIEAETAALEGDVAHREGLVSSRLGAAEACRAARRVGSKGAMRGVDEALDAIYLIEIDEEVCRGAGELKPKELKTSDAIHLATALSIEDPDLVFITYDAQLAKAAESNGLKVVQPGLRRR